jgi:hypothetical protein
VFLELPVFYHTKVWQQLSKKVTTTGDCHYFLKSNENRFIVNQKMIRQPLLLKNVVKRISMKINSNN